MSPRRLRRSRARGWRTPDGAVYVGRPTRWGNPFRVGDVVASTDGFGIYAAVVDPELAVALYRGWLTLRGRRGDGPDVSELAGHDLVCWCPPDQPCHADVLLELANPREA